MKITFGLPIILDYIKEDETFILSILLPKSFSIIGASLNKSEMFGD